jgi:CBS domain containing-hemolysin-like protein
MTLLIAFAALSILVSFICSILEAALLSLTPSYIAHQKLERPKLYERLKHLKDNIDKPLAAILTLNTIAHTVGATGVGAQVTIVFGDGYLGIASAIMTLLILVLSEILPKTIGARYWRAIAPFLPPVLRTMIVVLKPFIMLSDMVMKLFGGKPPEHDIRQEIKALGMLGRELDKLDDDEQRVISNILDLHEVKVKDIMTPRIVCNSARPDETIAELKSRIRESQFSRYPVVAEDESPLGVVFRYDALMAEDEDQPVSSIMKPIKVTLESVNAENLMSQLMQERQHMSLIYDEFGGWQGLVTLEDIVEAIIGKPIMDETDDIPNMRRFARRRWEHRLRGSRAK